MSDESAKSSSVRWYHFNKSKSKYSFNKKESQGKVDKALQEIVYGNENNSVLYGRKWRVLINDGETVALDVSSLHVAFEIQQNALGKPATCHLIIHNLSAETEARIIEKGFFIQVEAGYAPQYGIIFEGEIIQVFRNRENGVDYKLEILAATQANFMGINYVRTTLAAGSKPRDIVESVAKVSYYPIEVDTVSENLPKTELPRGKVIFAYPGDVLNDVAKGTDSFYHVTTEGKLNFRKYSDPIPEDKSIVLTPMSGLVGTPEYTDEGIAIKMLLDPRVQIHTMIKISNDLISRKMIDVGHVTSPNINGGGGKMADQNIVFDQDGEYEVYSLVHSGDSHSNDWTTSVIGIGRNGRTGLPIMVDSAEKTVRGT